MNSFLTMWMLWNAVLGGGLLTLGCLIAAALRSPVRRLRLLEWTLVAALGAPLLGLLNQQVSEILEKAGRVPAGRLWSRSAFRREAKDGIPVFRAVRVRG